VNLETVYRRLDPNNPIRRVARVGRLFLKEDLSTLEERRAAELSRLQERHAAELSMWHHRVGTLDAEKTSLLYDGTRWRWQAKALARELYGEPQQQTLPPREIPPHLVDGFTMGGRVPIIPRYVDCTYPSNWPLIYTDEEIDSYMDRIRADGTYIYGGVDQTVQEALRRYPVKGRDVVTMGSLTPWYEAMILVHGGNAHTIDYNPIIVRTSRIKAWTVAQWERERPQFDYAISISSFEHDGLGAFGDPLDPDGDLKAMQKMKEILKPGGIMLFAVPTGKDAVQFNAMRVYGRLRMPLMLKGWECIDSVAFEDYMYEDTSGALQPLLILKRPNPL
jgi:Caenorhabditis protein of unknown function, DUF268